MPPTKALPAQTTIHFGLKLRASTKYGLRLTRETYALPNKRSSLPALDRERHAKLWEAMAYRYEDEDHKIYTDEWCTKLREMALRNFDLNMAYFATLDHDEFEAALQQTVKSQRGMVKVTDLTGWDEESGLYIMVLDDYCQAYIGAGKVLPRIKRHWSDTKQFDRLIWGDEDTSILSIDSFRALDTTRIFAAESSDPFIREDALLNTMPSGFTLNRIMGGRDAVRFAEILGAEAVSRMRELS